MTTIEGRSVVTVIDVQEHRRAARVAFDRHAAALGALIRKSRSLPLDMCRWMSMNVSVFDDVAMALAAGAAEEDPALQERVALEISTLRDADPDLALLFEDAMIDGLRAAVLLRLGREDGATENGRRALQLILDSLGANLVPRIVDFGMAARARRGRFSRIASAVVAALSRLVGLPATTTPFSGWRRPHRDLGRSPHVTSPPPSKAVQNALDGPPPS